MDLPRQAGGGQLVGPGEHPDPQRSRRPRRHPVRELPRPAGHGLGDRPARQRAEPRPRRAHQLVFGRLRALPPGELGLLRAVAVGHEPPRGPRPRAERGQRREQPRRRALRPLPHGAGLRAVREPARAGRLRVPHERRQPDRHRQHAAHQHRRHQGRDDRVRHVGRRGAIADLRGLPRSALGREPRAAPGLRRDRRAPERAHQRLGHGRRHDLRDVPQRAQRRAHGRRDPGPERERRHGAHAPGLVLRPPRGLADRRAVRLQRLLREPPEPLAAPRGRRHLCRLPLQGDHGLRRGRQADVEPLVPRGHHAVRELPLGQRRRRRPPGGRPGPSSTRSAACGLRGSSRRSPPRWRPRPASRSSPAPTIRPPATTPARPPPPRTSSSPRRPPRPPTRGSEPRPTARARSPASR